MFITCAVVLLVSVSWTTTGLARAVNPPGRFLENKLISASVHHEQKLRHCMNVENKRPLKGKRINKIFYTLM